MRFDHLVKFAGRYWPAGSDVPIGEKVKTEKAPEEPERKPTKKTTKRKAEKAE